MRTRAYLLPQSIGLLLFAGINFAAWAHPISISWAEVKVGKSSVDIRLRILAEDLYLFHQLESNDLDVIAHADLERAASKHKAFIQQYFYLENEKGRRLHGTFTDMETEGLPKEGIPVADLMEHSLFYQLEYPVNSAPQQLAIYQQFGGLDNVINAIMMLEVEQEGIGDLTPAEVRKERPYYLTLDWENPAQASDLSDRFARMKQQKAQQDLGINSYSSLYSFIYITDFEVRHEILIPLATLETWFALERAEPLTITVEEQQAAKAEIEGFFRKHNPVTIDGISVQPLTQRIDFYGLDFKDFAQRASQKPLNTAHARVGVILRYETKGTPTKVVLEWDSFNEQVRKLKSVVYAFDQNLSTQFQTDSPTYVWENKNGSSLPNIGQVAYQADGSWLSWLTDSFSSEDIPEEEAKTIFQTLHKNIYRAFDYRREEAVYDALEKSVSGDLLADLYLQIRKGLMMQEQGGAIARVNDVEIRTGTVQPLETADDHPQFGYLCTWTVNGTVEHWGHIHERTNEYTALFTVKAMEGAWKITDLKTLNQKRLQFKTSIRQLW